MRLAPILKDPLTHFLAAGLALYLLLSSFHPTERQDAIFVDRQSLLAFYQYRANAFEKKAASAVLASLGEDEKRQLLSQYIREEALMREAARLSLDRSDYVIRRRMAQKAEFLASAALNAPEPSETELISAYERTKSEYISPARVTFTHIFFSSAAKDSGQVVAEASRLLSTLRAIETRTAESQYHGDRFPYHRNYVERPFEYVKAHFGADAAEAIFSRTSALNRWRGPILSDHGAHLVFVSNFQPARQSPYLEVRDRVRSALVQEIQAQARNDAVENIVSDYSVVIDPVLLDDGWPAYEGL